MERNSGFSIVVVVWSLVVFFAPSARAQYGGGTGEPNDPYLIYTAEQLQAIGDDPNDWSKHFKLMADLDLAAYPDFLIPIKGGRGRGFSGVFDGNGHTIVNFTVHTDEARVVGLFTYVWGPDAEIRSLGLIDPVVENTAGIFTGALIGSLTRGKVVDCYVEGARISGISYVGGLIGDVDRGTLVNCRAEGAVRGQDYVGRLVGDFSGTLTNCGAEGSVYGEKYVGGLVGYAGWPSLIGDSYSDCRVDANSMVGGLVGDLHDGVAAGCHATGDVTGREGVGGLVGSIWYMGIADCYATGDVCGEESRVGGLVGANWGRAILGCHASGDVSGGNLTGGLVGDNGSAEIQDCYASGDVSGADLTGGLVGAGGRTITACGATGNVSGRNDVGGLVGAGGWAITACRATGNVTGVRNVGGLAGYGADTVTDSYATGDVTADTEVGGLMGSPGYFEILRNCYAAGAVYGNSDTGGLVGRGGSSRNGIIEGCFWDIETSGQTRGVYGTGRTTAEMQMAANFVGWRAFESAGLWTFDDGNDYPRLSWEDRPGTALEPLAWAGTGTKDDPYQIHTAEELALIGWAPSHWDKHFILMADIDLSPFRGAVFNIIGAEWDHPFTGVFEGNGHTVSNLQLHRVNDSYYVQNIGLFGYVFDPNAEIRNLGLIDPNVSVGRQTLVGALVGYLFRGTVANCSVRGGVLKASEWNAVLSDSAPRRVESLSHTRQMDIVIRQGIGGLVGWSCGTIRNCLSTACICGYGYSAGGLVGVNQGTISHCYAASVMEGEGYPDQINGLAGGFKGLVQASFWDVEASGLATSAGGTGLTTAEMIRAATFVEVGWDFMGETANGTEDLWWILEGQDYPRLWFEADGADVAEEQ